MLFSACSCSDTSQYQEDEHAASSQGSIINQKDGDEAEDCTEEVVDPEIGKTKKEARPELDKKLPDIRKPHQLEEKKPAEDKVNNTPTQSTTSSVVEDQTKKVCPVQKSRG